MPYRSQHGTHYHMQQGCSGAWIPCGLANLLPCMKCSVVIESVSQSKHTNASELLGILGGRPSTKRIQQYQLALDDIIQQASQLASTTECIVQKYKYSDLLHGVVYRKTDDSLIVHRKSLNMMFQHRRKTHQEMIESNHKNSTKRIKDALQRLDLQNHPPYQAEIPLRILPIIDLSIPDQSLAFAVQQAGEQSRYAHVDVGKTAHNNHIIDFGNIYQQPVKLSSVETEDYLVYLFEAAQFAKQPVQWAGRNWLVVASGKPRWSRHGGECKSDFMCILKLIDSDPRQPIMQRITVSYKRPDSIYVDDCSRQERYIQLTHDNSLTLLKHLQQRLFRNVQRYDIPLESRGRTLAGFQLQCTSEPVYDIHLPVAVIPTFDIKEAYTGAARSDQDNRVKLQVPTDSQQHQHANPILSEILEKGGIPTHMLRSDNFGSAQAVLNQLQTVDEYILRHPRLFLSWRPRYIKHGEKVPVSQLAVWVRPTQHNESTLVQSLLSLTQPWNFSEALS